MKELDSATRRHLRDELRDARAAALADSEGFGDVLVAIERVGSIVTGRAQSLGKYGPFLRDLAATSPLAGEVPGRHPEWHTPFEALYELVRAARNDAVHQGAYARSLADHAVQLALVLEDALMANADKVRDFMVRDVTCAEMFQPLSAVRQMLLSKSYSLVPINVPDASSLDEPKWMLLSDRCIAQYLRVADVNARSRRLAETVQEALRSGLAAEQAATCKPDDSAVEVLAREDQRIVLVIDPRSPDRLAGILTPFDLL